MTNELKAWFSRLDGAERRAAFAFAAIFVGIMLFVAGVRIGEAVGALAG